MFAKAMKVVEVRSVLRDEEREDGPEKVVWQLQRGEALLLSFDLQKGLRRESASASCRVGEITSAVERLLTRSARRSRACLRARLCSSRFVEDRFLTGAARLRALGLTGSDFSTEPYARGIYSLV